jgi:hypothetical protein
MDRKSKKKKKKQQQRQDVESVRKGGGDEESSGEPDSDFRFKRLKERYVSHSSLDFISQGFQIHWAYRIPYSLYGSCSGTGSGSGSFHLQAKN